MTGQQNALSSICRIERFFIRAQARARQMEISILRATFLCLVGFRRPGSLLIGILSRPSRNCPQTRCKAADKGSRTGFSNPPPPTHRPPAFVRSITLLCFHILYPFLLCFAHVLFATIYSWSYVFPAICTVFWSVICGTKTTSLLFLLQSQRDSASAPDNLQ